MRRISKGNTAVGMAAVFGFWLASPLVHAGPITVGGPWYEFTFTGPGATARGAYPADPFGLFASPSPGGNSAFADAPPWTFTAPAGGVLFTVTDAFSKGDAFDLFDSGLFLGGTPSVPPSFVGTSADPAVAALDPTYSHASFLLAAGPHSLTIISREAPFGVGAAYFRADAAAVAEPPTVVPGGIGILGLLSYTWRRNRAGGSWRALIHPPSTCPPG